MDITIEQSVEGVTLLVPRGYDATTCLTVPAIDTDQRWNAVIAEGGHAILCERDIRSSKIIVEAGAQLDLISLQITPHPSGHAVTKRIIVRDNAVVRLFTGLFESADVTMIGELQGNHTAFENHVMYFASGKQRMRMALNAEHSGQDTMSRTLVRGVAVENGHADFAGSINIHQTGRQADGHLEHEGLLMSQKARIDSLPGLQIDTDEVKASHSSAIHYVRPEQIFYLQSRGLDSGTARRLIVAGFLEQMLATVREPQLLSEIHALVQNKQDLIPHE